MENFERLSSKVLVRTCHCGIVFETYDPKKVYHANSCRANYVRKNMDKERELIQKKFDEKVRE